MPKKSFVVKSSKDGWMVQREGKKKCDDYLVIESREEAIYRAVALAKPGDLVLVAGKGRGGAFFGRGLAVMDFIARHRQTRGEMPRRGAGEGLLGSQFGR